MGLNLRPNNSTLVCTANPSPSFPTYQFSFLCIPSFPPIFSRSPSFPWWLIIAQRAFLLSILSPFPLCLSTYQFTSQFNSSLPLHFFHPFLPFFIWWLIFSKLFFLFLLYLHPFSTSFLVSASVHLHVPNSFFTLSSSFPWYLIFS